MKNETKIFMSIFLTFMLGKTIRIIALPNIYNEKNASPHLHILTQKEINDASLKQQDGYVISKPGIYRLGEDVTWLVSTCDSFAITIAANNVILDGDGHFIKQMDHSVRHAIGIQIKPEITHVKIQNITLDAISGGGIWFRGGNAYLTVQDVKMVNCAYYGLTALDTNALGPDMPSFVAQGILFDGGYGRPIKDAQVIDCVFVENGILRTNKPQYESVCGAIEVYQASNVTIKGCTIDGCVGRDISWGITLASIMDVLVSDVFIADVFSSQNSKGIYTYDIDGEIKDTPQFSRASNIDPNYFGYFLDNHTTTKDHIENNNSFVIEASLLKGVIPKYQEKEAPLVNEHKWREFRGLHRLVCHNSQIKSKTSGIYAKWVELFCKKVLGVKVKVESGFANLYLNGNTPLPLHRDQYKKWIFGLSFGETRTIDFIPDNKNAEIISYTMEAGDVLLFSPEVNNRYQHRMLAEPERIERRINLTYFLEILPGEDSNKLLHPLTVSSNSFPTFEEAEAIYNQMDMKEPAAKAIIQDEHGNLFEEVNGALIPYKEVVS